jgi:hypothetical protein
MNDEKKNKPKNKKESLDGNLDGKKLHDLYRHSTKLIK